MLKTIEETATENTYRRDRYKMRRIKNHYPPTARYLMQNERRMYDSLNNIPCYNGMF